MTDRQEILELAPVAPSAVVPHAGNGTAASPPSVESMLMLAIENKVDPETLERLVALSERVAASRAEQAFNAAMAAFRAECPAIVKNRDATDPKRDGRRLYSYADLSEITKVVDPILNRHGLTYTWDSDVQADQTVITCTVCHVDGHKRSSKFACKGSGTSLMVAAQVAASATTFGRRYSLVFALGLTIDEDDDGRRAAPMPQPERDPTTPTVGTREERREAAANPTPDDGIPRVTSDALNALYRQWKQKSGEQAPTPAKFGQWAQKVLKAAKPLDGVGDWTIDALDACREALQ